MLLSPPKKGGYVLAVCLFVCLSVPLSAILLKSYDFDAIFGGMGVAQGTIDYFGGELDHDPNHGFLDLDRNPDSEIVESPLYLLLQFL